MRPLDTLELGKRWLKINGHTVEATITAKIHLDQDFQLDWDFKPGEKEKLEHQIDRGDCTPCGIVVTARAEGIEGSDSLWGTLVFKSEDIHRTIADHDMINEACAELRRELIGMAQRLAKYAEVQS